MNTALQYIKRFALSTYYGLRQYFVQYFLFSIMAWKFIFGAPKSLQMVTAAMKLKNAYSLEGKI